MKRLGWWMAAVALIVAGTACGDDSDKSRGDDDDASGGAGGAASASSNAATNGSGGGGDVIPSNSQALLPWLQAGNYQGWASESAPHDSAGPHFGLVRTFINDTLDGSLMAGGDGEHPQGSATVKELYGMGTTVLGWSVSVKTTATSDAGQGWYWYEVYNDTVFGDGNGDGTCVGCHSSGQDYVRTPYPLQ